MWSGNLSINKSDYTLKGVFYIYGKPRKPFEDFCKRRNPLYGELGIIGNFDVSLSNVSHIVESVKLDELNHRLNVTCRILDTPSGKVLKSIIDEGLGSALKFRLRTVSKYLTTIHKIFTVDIDTNDKTPSDILRKERKDKLEKIYGKS